MYDRPALSDQILGTPYWDIEQCFIIRYLIIPYQRQRSQQELVWTIIFSPTAVPTSSECRRRWANDTHASLAFPSMAGEHAKA